MPHERERALSAKVVAGLKWSPVIGIYGLRQIGKTTLVKRLAERFNGEYETFDNESVLEASRAAPAEFCDRHRLLCVDEAQKAPWIFPAIKDRVGTRRKPGRFLLTGSVRFSLKSDIRESLTGRILLHELLPFSLAETHGRRESRFLAFWFASVPEEAAALCHNAPTETEITRYMRSGGMPIPCFTRDEARRREWFRAYAETLIMRDLSLADASLRGLGYRQGVSFLRQLALAQGREANVSQLAGAAALRPAAAKKVLSALEALCVIDLVMPESRVVKSVKKPRVEWKDIALWNHFYGVPDHLLNAEVTALSVLLAQEFRSQIALMDEAPSWSCDKTRDGAHIPWVFRLKGKTLALTHFPSETVRTDDVRALARFVARDPRSVGIVLAAAKAPTLPLGKRLWMMPYTAVF